MYRDMELCDAETSFEKRQMRMIDDFQRQIESLKEQHDIRLAREVKRANEAVSMNEKAKADHDKAAKEYAAQIF